MRAVEWEWWSGGVVEWWSGGVVGVVGVVGLGVGVGSSGRRVESRDATRGGYCDATRGGYCDATRGGYCDATRGVSTLLLVESRLGYSWSLDLATRDATRRVSTWLLVEYRHGYSSSIEMATHSIDIAITTPSIDSITRRQQTRQLPQ